MAVAYELGKFESEVRQLMPHELARWIAYFNLKSENEKKAMEEARDKAKRQAPRRRKR